MIIGRILDVSSDQHPNDAPINWAQVARAGVSAVFIKATQGTGYTNPWLQSDLAGAAKAGLATAAYHFAGMGDPTAEAEVFLKAAGAKARMLDYETNTNVAWARTFLAALGRPADELITYGSASTLKDFYVRLPSFAFPAAYNQGYPGWGVCWQFTDAATMPGISVPVDESSWHGSEIQYDTLFGIYDPVPVPPLPVPIKEETMSMDVLPSGEVVISAVGAGSRADHLLVFTLNPTNPASPGFNVIDVTDGIGTADPYTVVSA